MTNGGSRMFNSIFGLLFMFVCFAAGAVLAVQLKKHRDKKAGKEFQIF